MDIVSTPPSQMTSMSSDISSLPSTPQSHSTLEKVESSSMNNVTVFSSVQTLKADFMQHPVH